MERLSTLENETLAGEVFEKYGRQHEMTGKELLDIIDKETYTNKDSCKL